MTDQAIKLAVERAARAVVGGAILIMATVATLAMLAVV